MSKEKMVVLGLAYGHIILKSRYQLSPVAFTFIYLTRLRDMV